jgi:hypothetical protein
MADTPGLLVVLGGGSAATFAVGYYVRNWWAILAPAVTLIGLEAALLWVGTHGDASGAALLIWITLIFFAPVVWLVGVGIKRAERAQRSRELNRDTA